MHITLKRTLVIKKKPNIYTLKIHKGTRLPESLKTFGETDDVLDHVSGEVHHMRQSSEYAAFPNFLSFLGPTIQTGGRR